MKQVTVKFAVTILTFIIGITAAAVWFNQSNRRFPDDIYFPVGVFSPLEGGMNWGLKSYSSSLAAMQEPPLSSLKDENAEAYRFVWNRSFHPPVSVRLYRAQSQIYVSVKQLSDVGLPMNGEIIFPKTLIVNETRPMAEAEWERFQELLKESDFWTMPTVDATPPGLDGAGWLLEGVKSRRYHVVERQSPEHGGYREACVYLLRISGVRVDEAKGELY